MKAQKGPDDVWAKAPSSQVDPSPKQPTQPRQAKHTPPGVRPPKGPAPGVNLTSLVMRPPSCLLFSPRSRASLSLYPLVTLRPSFYYLPVSQVPPSVIRRVGLLHSEADPRLRLSPALPSPRCGLFPGQQAVVFLEGLVCRCGSYFWAEVPGPRDVKGVEEKQVASGPSSSWEPPRPFEEQDHLPRSTQKPPRLQLFGASKCTPDSSPGDVDAGQETADV